MYINTQGQRSSYDGHSGALYPAKRDGAFAGTETTSASTGVGMFPAPSEIMTGVVLDKSALASMVRSRSTPKFEEGWVDDKVKKEYQQHGGAGGMIKYHTGGAVAVTGNPMRDFEDEASLGSGGRRLSDAGGDV